MFCAAIELNSLGQPVRLIAPNGQITELTINDANHLTQIHYEDASRYDFSYSEGGLLTEKIDPRGERYTRQYNDIGRVEQATDSAGGLWQTFNNKLGLNESLFGYTTAEGNAQQVEQRVLPNGDTLQTTTTLSGAERVRLTSEDQLTESITAYGMSQVIHNELDEKTLQPVPRQITVTAPSLFRATIWAARG